MLGLKQVGETKICIGCKHAKAPQEFQINKTTKQPCATCSDCSAKRRDQAKRRRDRVPAGKQQCQWCRKILDVDVSFGINPSTQKPYVWCEPCRKGPAGSASREQSKKFFKTDKGKAVTSKYVKSDKGQARIVKARNHLNERRRNDPGLALDNKLLTIAAKLLRDPSSTNDEFVEKTSFTSASEFVAAVRCSTDKKEFKFSEFGETWVLDHKIPRTAFDFNDPEDVQRCWSKKNVHALTEVDNKAKWCKLLDHYLLEAGAENFPKAWNGQLPDEDFKKAFYQRCLSHKEVAGPSSSSIDGPASEDELSEPDSD